MTFNAVASSDLAGEHGEFPMSQSDFNRIATILHTDSGIHLTEGKTALVYSRLSKRLRMLGLESFRDYCELISSEAGADERNAMLNALTTNVTAFFREPHHFEHLANHLKSSGLADKVRSGGKLRIWSAGCSSGEEPYSIAATLLNVFPNAASLDIRILATDIDKIVLAKARAGVYPVESVEQMPDAYRTNLYKTDAHGDATFTPAVRGLIAFNSLNLMAPNWPMKGQFDAIFCRNVAIYFEEETQQKLWRRYYNLLTPDGRLYIGHSERVVDPDFKNDGLTVYKRKESA